MITDTQRWQIRILADNGFSYHLIACRVFPEEMFAGRGTGHKFMTKVPSALHYRIWRVLQQEGIKLRDYRNGRNDVARQVIRTVTRRRKAGVR